MFESREDVRYFLSQLARQVRAGRIEIHAYCVLQTHYHLLVRSPCSQLSEAMRRTQNQYTRRFNRLHRRDGSLTRGRFFSRIVESDEYFRTLVRYIDLNPIRAALDSDGRGYEHGSATHYAHGTRPPWLRRDWIERLACAWTGSDRYSPDAYRRAFAAGDESQCDALEELVEGRLAARDVVNESDLLLAAARSGVGAWMRWKARLADGAPLSHPTCGQRALRRTLDEDTLLHGVWMVEDGRRTWRGVELAWFGLLRQLCGLSVRRIAVQEDGSIERTRYRIAAHSRLLLANGEYARRAMEVGRLAVLRGIDTGTPAKCGTSVG